MTIRDIAIAFGYEVDKSSEKKAEKSVKSLRSTATKLLGAIGVGFSLTAAIGAVKKFAANNEEVKKAVSQVRGEWDNWKKEIDGTYGISKKLAQFIVRGMNQALKAVKRVTDGFIKLGNRIGGVDKLLKLLAIAAGAIFIALNAGKIMAFIKSLGQGLSKINVKMLAMVAVIIIVALLIEDLIKFMQGEDSLLGALLEKFGIDGDEVRDTIRGILEAVKGLLPFILELGKQLGVMLLGVLKELLPFLIDIAKEVIPFIIDVVKELIPFLVEIVKAVLPVIIDLVKKLLPFVVEIVKKVLPAIVSLLQRLLPVVLEIVRKVLPVIVDLIQRLLPLAMEIIDKILPVIIGLIEKLIPVVMQIIDTVLPIWIALFEKMLPIWMQFIDAVLPVFISLVETLISAIGPIVDAIFPMLISLLESLVPVITFVAELLGNVLGAAFDALIPIVNAVMGIFQGLIDFITAVFTGDWSKAWDAVVNIFKSIIDGIAAIFKAPINLIITGINTFIGGLNKIKIPDWVPVVGGKGFSIDPLPLLAKGGVLEKGQTGLLEGSGAEAVVPLEKNTGWISKVAALFTESISGDAASMFGGLAQTLKDLASLGATPRPETVAAATSSVENKNITQNVEITNQFHGDRAGQQKSAEAMGKAADDATGQLARGLAYAR